MEERKRWVNARSGLLIAEISKANAIAACSLPLQNFPTFAQKRAALLVGDFFEKLGVLDVSFSGAIVFLYHQFVAEILSFSFTISRCITPYPKPSRFKSLSKSRCLTLRLTRVQDWFCMQK